MDIIAQLQDQVNKIAYIAFNTVGSLQRDAPPARLSQNYPEPPELSAEALATINNEPKEAATSFMEGVKQFDALVAALPLNDGGEEAQLKKIAELQAENESVGKEVQEEMQAAERELKQLRELFHMAADNCLRLKPPS
ncbi:hypothetical protein R1sor_022780 [Riccia sorocarpa]|uniref:Mediator of RNA polymerase II transcription subunit 21 n=1 Tax=Riccia sorocarpa TaxID=122646 RepID=A0ABD3GQ30_9MARC